METDSFLRFFFACKRRFKRFSLEKIAAYQLKEAQKLVKFIVSKSTFFSEYFRTADLSAVWTLPTVNKRIMMENLTAYNTVGLTKEELLAFTTRVEKEERYGERLKGFNVALSSGTSGNRGIVITSPAEEKYLQAAFFARFSFPRVLRMRWAFLLRITTPAFQVKKFGQQLTHFSLKLPLEVLRQRLESFQPNILSAPPSMLKILAKEIQEERLTIQPKRVVSYAEVLEPELKTELEEIFHTPIHQIYQASEGALGLTCKAGSLHINEDLVKLQLLNKDGTDTLPGTPSFQSVVTDLHKTSQPIVRFELNDIITISPEKCSCGSSFRVIEHIMGRADDMFWGERKDTNELQYIFPDYIRRAIIISSEHIEEYQAIQKSPTKVLVRVLLQRKERKNEKLTETLQKNIAQVFTSYKCQPPRVEVRFEAPVKNRFSGKLIRIHRAFEV